MMCIISLAGAGAERGAGSLAGPRRSGGGRDGRHARERACGSARRGPPLPCRAAAPARGWSAKPCRAAGRELHLVLSARLGGRHYSANSSCRFREECFCVTEEDSSTTWIQQYMASEIFLRNRCFICASHLASRLSYGALLWLQRPRQRHSAAAVCRRAARRSRWAYRHSWKLQGLRWSAPMRAWLLWSLSGNVLQPRCAESHKFPCLKAASTPGCMS